MNNATDQYNWIAEIPETCQLVKLKYLSRIATGSFDTQDKLENGLYPFFVRSQKIEKINKYTHEGEAVMTAGDGVGVGKVFHYYIGKFAAHQRLYVFNNFKQGVLGKYIYYSVMSNLKFEVLQGNAKSTVDSLRYPMLANFPIILPDYDIQIKVVNFLDQKTTEIDDLITDKEKLIKLLEEKREAVITEAVTKGLDPNVKVKESGVEWIGEIPEHWVKTKLKFFGKSIIGLTYSPNDVVSSSNGNLVLRSNNIQNGKIFTDTIDKNVYVSSRVPEQLRIKKGDILICSRNGSRHLIGKSGYAEKKHEGYTFGAFTTVFRSKQNKFIYYVFMSNLFQSQIGTYLTATINQLTVTNLNNLRIALPPSSEQQLIVNYLNQYKEYSNYVIDTEKKLINKLKEYRQSLIYEAVTGKIDVREMVGETEQEEVSSS